MTFIFARELARSDRALSFYAPRPKVQPMAEENHASLIFWRFNKMANHKWPMCAHSAKATY